MSTAGPGTTEQLSHRQVMLVMSGLLLGMLLSSLDQTIVSTALPRIVSDLGGLEHLAWVTTAYLLAATVTTPVWGKLGDLFGRKHLFQAAIVLFLLGSVASGAAQSMAQLIASRGLQGLGAGGLMVLAMAIVADVVSPRERGRYQGLFGAVFGASSIAGPLLGGFFTDHLSWRWVFYINLPLGVAALVVTSLVLKNHPATSRPRIDYRGATLLAAAAGSTVLLFTWGGSQYSWRSGVITGLAVLALTSAVAFLLVERRAPEPIMPLRLFADRTFQISSAAGFVVGLAMFGAIVYMPLYLQVVGGASATNSGLLMLPLMGGLLVSSVVAGHRITRTGRYRVFPIAGTATATAGMALLSTMDADTPMSVAMTWMVVLGVGIGLVMQVLVLATQNTVAHRDLGVATSTVTFFRSIGGSVGVSVFGSIFNARLADNLARLLPPGSTDVSGDVEAMAALPAGLERLYQVAYADALTATFRYAVPIMAAAVVLAWLLPEKPLRGRPGRPPTGEPGPGTEEPVAQPTA